MYPTVDQTFHLAICGHNSPDRDGRHESIRGFSRLFSHVQNRSRYRALLILVWLRGSKMTQPSTWSSQPDFSSRIKEVAKKAETTTTRVEDEAGRARVETEEAE